MTENAAFRILDKAWEAGLRAFDTAEAYGCSTRRLRTWSDTRKITGSIEVITKCRADDHPHGVELTARAKSAMDRFDGVGRLTLLTHGAIDADSWSVVLEATKARDVAAGQSVYAADEVIAAGRLRGVSRIQAPANVLDLRALDARGDSLIPLDLRSVYLQGILLDDPEMAEQRAPGSAYIVEVVQSAARDLNVLTAPLLIASMISAARADDRLVIGVDDPSEVDALPQAFEISDAVVREFRDVLDHHVKGRVTDSMLDPRTWPASKTS